MDKLLTRWRERSKDGLQVSRWEEIYQCTKSPSTEVGTKILYLWETKLNSVSTVGDRGTVTDHFLIVLIFVFFRNNLRDLFFTIKPDTSMVTYTSTCTSLFFLVSQVLQGIQRIHLLSDRKDMSVFVHFIKNLYNNY